MSMKVWGDRWISLEGGARTSVPPPKGYTNVKIFNKKNKSPFCPNLKKRIEALVFKLLMEEKESLGCRKRKFDEGLVEILRLMRGVAMNPSKEADGEWKDKILRARMATFLRVLLMLHGILVWALSRSM
ncbi:uncharacterized protein A4U43_C02F6600 [Asparagus officinalis]|uniref:Uncharacterized protein n=1 Tax=Asparagus officinalis TaxID=4686 RepID=A0A5P1FGE2_ASPOF|nr:uncharacterized protein A4U43_C02F6600 [Asparagus officinalis]